MDWRVLSLGLTGGLRIPDHAEKEVSMFVQFECEECEHEWSAIPNPSGSGHAWESCPKCGADDGENCWDCGVDVEDEGLGGEMCADCRHTLCWECTGGQRRSFNDIHRNGREHDGKPCGTTTRVL